MARCIAFFCALAAYAFAVELGSTRALFEQWRVEQARVYNSVPEKDARFAAFAQNYAAMMMAQQANPLATYKLDSFADWSLAELRGLRGGARSLPQGAQPVQPTEAAVSKAHAAGAIDWVTRGVVTTPTSQGRCGTCQDFSAIADIEGAWALAGNPLTKFSEQELIDCGGGDGYGMKWVAAHGVATNKDVPLANHSDPTLAGCRGITNCTAALEKSHAHIDGVSCLTNHNESNILAMLQHGPVSVSICAGPLNGYHSGIINCTGTGIDHAVTLVGYGEENGTQYWKLKNSWGAAFGEGGYVRFRYGNTCLRGPCQAYIGKPPAYI